MIVSLLYHPAHFYSSIMMGSTKAFKKAWLEGVCLHWGHQGSL